MDNKWSHFGFRFLIFILYVFPVTFLQHLSHHPTFTLLSFHFSHTLLLSLSITKIKAKKQETETVAKQALILRAIWPLVFLFENLELKQVNCNNCVSLSNSDLSKYSKANMNRHVSFNQEFWIENLTHTYISMTWVSHSPTVRLQVN